MKASEALREVQADFARVTRLTAMAVQCNSSQSHLTGQLYSRVFE
jgi:hypothetical protein